MIHNRKTVFETKWFSVEAKKTDLDDEPFYSLKLPDYVAVVPWTSSGEIVCVRQYRPAVEREVLELPSGLVDPGDTHRGAAERELQEETGYSAVNWSAFGPLFSDTGRLQNQMWCFAAYDVERLPNWQPEPGVEVVLLDSRELRVAIRDGRFRHALHLAALAIVCDLRMLIVNAWKTDI